MGFTVHSQTLLTATWVVKETPCGGPTLLDLYNFTGTYPIGASVAVPSVDAWVSQGCYRYSTIELSIPITMHER